MSMYAVDGMLSGYFSVSADKTVAFSRGNLQANYDGSLWTWYFAEHQWDVVGEAVANTAISDNGVVSSNGTVDLFGWSTKNTYYGINNDANNSTYSGDFKDWGETIGEGWRTLTNDEWKYIFNSRDNAAKLHGQAMVNDVHGYILLPDGADPVALGFTATPNNWTTNQYSGDSWTALANAGAVFLPCTGYRSGQNVVDIGAHGNEWYGNYWSATPINEDNIYSLQFGKGFVAPSYSKYRQYGASVRLVREVAPQEGDLFKAASGSDTLQYQVTQITPNYEVKVTQSGHVLKEETDLVIPASVNYIGRTFAVTAIEYGPNFANVRTLQLPASLTSEISWGYGDLSSLQEFVVQAGSTIYTTDNGVLYSPDKKTLYRCPPKHDFKSADFLPETKKLENDAFRNNIRIGDLVIPNTVNHIGASTFKESSLTSVVIPSTVGDLADNTFGSCEHLTSVTFENSAGISLAYNSFAGSKILTDQTGDFQVIDSVAIHYQGTAETVILPDSIVNIAYSFIFTSTNAYVRDAVAENLTTVVLPASLKAVDHRFLDFSTYPLAKYPKLEKIICKSQTVPNVIGSALELSSEKPITLVVPCGKSAVYSAATKFSGAFDIVEEDLIYDINLKQTDGGTIAYTRMAECNEIELTATPAAGYKFVKWSDDNTDVKRTVVVNSDVTFSAEFMLETPTALDETENRQSSNRKLIIDGQLLIEQNGKIYNAQGTEMK